MCVGAAASVVTGFAISLFTGADYSWKDAAADAALGAVGAGLAGKLGKLGRVAMGAREASAGKVVIGETMERVTGYAEKIGAETFETEASTVKQMWKENSGWLRKAMKSGKEVVDIGTDASRAKPSKFYQAEKELLKQHNYPVTSTPQP